MMIRIPTDLIAKTVTPALKSREEIAGAYLFGSALELCRPDSDIDIGLVIDPLAGPPEEYYERIANSIANRLSRLNGHPFDVVPLNIINSIFAFKVIKSGRLIYNGRPLIVSDFIEKTSRQYAENYPRYWEALKMIVGV
ncbi:nucleotidyltransferase domain-containing protein [Moorella naiadis]|uniref:nucleotidyltransferase domain-containing protein n=1 Tax=Moorella naiadis (nom. illeg.) TaxID=3093670 RepID=UPI003D9CAFEB